MLKQILEAIENKKNVFITGSAGTGKSYLLGKLKEIFPNMNVTASTGAAAVNVEGVTIHSFAGLGIGDRNAQKCCFMMKAEARERLLSCSILAIDEISMLSADIFDLLNNVLKIIRKCDQPFGGIQLIVIGDFLQLPPVSRDKQANFAFESNAWREAEFENILLEKVYRQEDIDFLEILHRARFGYITESDCQKIQEPKVIDDHIHLFALNYLADSFNFSKLRNLKSKNFYFQGQDYGDPTACLLLEKYCLAPKELFLKEGARVMCLLNEAQELGIINGSMGSVINLTEDSAEVLFDNNITMTFYKKKVSQIKIGEKVIAYREQLPLRLAWSFSIHKSQGMTLAKVKIDMKGIFEYGQAYVALSRAKTLDGLSVCGMTAECVKAHPKALDFMNELKGALR